MFKKREKLWKMWKIVTTVVEKCNKFGKIVTNVGKIVTNLGKIVTNLGKNVTNLFSL